MTSDEMNAITEKLTSSFKRIGHNLSAMGVLGHVLRGDIAPAQVELSKLPIESVQELSAAAALLTSLADEEMIRRG